MIQSRKISKVSAPDKAWIIGRIAERDYICISKCTLCSWHHFFLPDVLPQAERIQQLSRLSRQRERLRWRRRMRMVRRSWWNTTPVKFLHLPLKQRKKQEWLQRFRHPLSGSRVEYGRVFLGGRDNRSGRWIYRDRDGPLHLRWRSCPRDAERHHSRQSELWRYRSDRRRDRERLDSY